VRMRRQMLGMSQGKLAGRLRLTFQQVQKYEKGTNRISASRLQEMSYILQVPVPFFFEGAPQIASRVGKDAEAPWPAYVSDFLANSDGLKLVRAFTQIKDAKLRRSLVRLVEEIAERQVPSPHHDHGKWRCKNAAGSHDYGLRRLRWYTRPQGSEIVCAHGVRESGLTRGHRFGCRYCYGIY
jgi:transcriptional regulator with XRE-family HTH domain